MSSGLAKILAVTAVVAACATIYQAYHHNTRQSVTVTEHDRLGQRAADLMASLAAMTTERDALLDAVANSVSRSSHDALSIRYESLRIAFDRSRQAEDRMARKIAELEHARGAGVAQVAVLQGRLKKASDQFDAVHRLYTGRFGPLVAAATERTRETVN